MDGRYGELFRQLREAKGMSLERAAGDVVSVSQLSRFEKGQSELVVSKLFALLDNIIVSPEEYVRTLRGYHLEYHEEFSRKSGQLEERGDFDGMRTLWQEAQQRYASSGQIQFKLDALTTQAILVSHGQAEDLTSDDVELVTAYLFDNQDWGRYELWLFLGMIQRQFTYPTCVLFADRLLQRTELYQSMGGSKDLVLMALRNLTGRALEEKDFQHAEKFLASFCHIIGGKATAETNPDYLSLLSGYYEQKGDYDQAITILSRVVFYYEHFSANRYLSAAYRKALDELKAEAARAKRQGS